MPHLERLEIPAHQTLQPADEPASSVHFPETGIFFMLATLEDGESAEVGVIGREGMLGIPLLLGAERMPFDAITHAGGTVLRLGAGAFRDELSGPSVLRPLLMRYAMASLVQVAQTAACNSRHHLDRRLARWLLAADDRVDGDSFPMTHEFLAMMLGVRRAGITVAAQALQRAGLIQYGAGRMQILDRPGLEAACCECYAVVEREFQRLLGPGTASRAQPCAEERGAAGRLAAPVSFA
ncbi:MAG: Crp/Fnr family transcriptional regulator [Rhodospirillales bacterium]|nr:Crp/Fnr family transcriptional regulator [Rhodospirillales bacterium]MBN8899116.1 Crp/Fnr family transcriptional regulator [Rhodospirillales bacterium]